MRVIKLTLLGLLLTSSVQSHPRQRKEVIQELMLYATRKVLQNGHSIESEYDVPQERNNVEKPATIHDVTEMLKEQDKQVYSTEIVL